MKKIYVLLLVTVSLISVLKAQRFEKGNKLIGGTISYSLQRSKLNNVGTTPNTNLDTRYISFSVALSLGFFTKPNRLTGFSLLYGFGSSVGSNQDFKIRNNSYGFSFYKQYWNELGKNFYFIIQGRAGLNYTHTKYEYTPGTINQSFNVYGVSVSVDPGFAYRIKPRLILDCYYSNFLSADYNYERRNQNGTNVSTTYSVGATTGLRNFSLDNVLIGFRYLL